MNLHGSNQCRTLTYMDVFFSYIVDVRLFIGYVCYLKCNLIITVAITRSLKKTD